VSLVLVTGGKGFLGQHLVPRLIEAGHEVRVLARPRSTGDQTKESEANVIWGDIRDRQTVEHAVEGVDRVIHLVSNFRNGGSDKKEAYSINVQGTVNVLNACLKHRIKHLIHCSTIGVHGNVKHIPANEETPFNPGDLYQETKLIAEKQVWEFYRQKGLPITVIRPISMLGPGDLRMLKLFRMIKKGWFVMVGNGEKLFQPAYIDDVTCGFVLCLGNKRAIGEVFIMGGEEHLSLRDLVQLVAAELDVAPPRFKVPLKPVLWLAELCEQVCVPLGLEPPLHRRRVSFFQNNRAFSVEKAKRILGYQPRVSLPEGIRRTIHWYEEHGWL